MMKIMVIHQAVSERSTSDEADVLTQVEAIVAALTKLGHLAIPCPVTLDLHRLNSVLDTTHVDMVFNIVESLGGYGRLLHLPATLCDARNIPYAGCSADALVQTSNKIHTKANLLAAQLPTPAWIEYDQIKEKTQIYGVASTQNKPDTWLIKSLWEHASIGIDDSCVVNDIAPAELNELMAVTSSRMGGVCFAEHYIDGREFNVALLAGARGVEALPPAEIVFVDFPLSKPKIVGYQAKWEPDSFEYKHTVRSFNQDASDKSLLREMQQLAIKCWHLFELSGWARVDFRVDSHGKPWILEINANPCLSPDAGFAAALSEAGYSFENAVERIIADGLRNHVLNPATTLKSNNNLKRKEITCCYRDEVEDADRLKIAGLVAATGFFNDEEIDVAVELVQERLQKGRASGYEFVIAEQEGQLIAYSCFGPTPCTRSSFDLYWIAVDPSFQGTGIGRAVLEETERRTRSTGGTRLYAETSSRPQYQSTRAFYERTGFTLAELLTDFYDTGDHRCTYVKIL